MVRNMSPKVSIIIPAYNVAGYIEETLASIFRQNFKDYEIIIVDDGSTDNIRDKLKAYMDRVIYIYQKNSGAPASPRNVGIKKACSPYISLYDADDIWLEHKLSRDIEFLEMNKDVSLVFSNFSLNENGKPLEVSWFEKMHVKEIMNSIPKRKSQNNFFVFERPIYNEILVNNFIGTSTVTGRREDFLQVGLFDENLIGIEDRDMWLRLSKANKIFGYTPEVLSYYRVSQNSISIQTKTLKSHICYYEKLLKNENNFSSRRIVKKRLGIKCFEYGFAMKNQGQYDLALFYYLKCAFYAGTLGKVRPIWAICKLPFFTISSLFKYETK